MKKTSRQFTKSRGDRPDMYQQVTDKIIVAIENGTLPWRKPWRTNQPRISPNAAMPCNGTTGYLYSGVNVLLLWIAAAEKGYEANRWLTYKQAQAVGGHVRAGETATLAVVFKPWDKQVEDTDGKPQLDDDGNPLKMRIPMLKPLYLFNVAQCDDLPDSVVCEPPAAAPEQDVTGVNEKIQEQINTMVEACGVQFDRIYQDKAFYSPGQDKIVLPQVQQFRTEVDYWSTLLHELVHSTGHAKRLNREGITLTSRRFGNPLYAFEELVAELGSAFLCAQLGIFGHVQHDSYLESWLKVLHEDKRAIFRASKQAREASEFLLTPLAEVEMGTTESAVAA